MRNETVELQVTVRNLSSRGAMIQGAEYAPVGTEISLQLANTGRVYGTVTWARGDLCGIRFNHPIDQQAARRKVSSDNFGRASLFVAAPKRSV
jgi:hypothetical protein